MFDLIRLTAYHSGKSPTGSIGDTYVITRPRVQYSVSHRESSKHIGHYTFWVVYTLYRSCIHGVMYSVQ